MAAYDLHQHLWPEPFVEALRGRSRSPSLAGDELTTVEGRFRIDLAAHEPAARVELLDRDELHVAVLSLQPSLGLNLLPDAERDDLEDAWVAGIRDVVRDSNGRFLALSPRRAHDGFAGVIIGASTLFDEGADSVLDDAEDRGVLVFVHPDVSGPVDPDRPSWWEWVTGYPARTEAAYLYWLARGRTRWPRLRVLFAMLAGGGPFQLERLALQGVDVRSALDRNTYFEVSTHGRRAIELCIETFGVDQLAYGSDTPVVDSRQTLRAVRGFGDSVAHILQTDTPSRLLA